MTPEIQQAMGEVARVQQDCQQSMLAHVYEVSEQMNPEFSRAISPNDEAENYSTRYSLPPQPLADESVKQRQIRKLRDCVEQRRILAVPPAEADLDLLLGLAIQISRFSWSFWRCRL